MSNQNDLLISPIDIRYYINVIVLTGAGISVASGLKPYRGPGGIWHDIDVKRFLSKTALAENPNRVWRFCAPLRDQLKHTEPNAAHYALAKFETKFRSYQSFTLVTQNIDGLHTRAGNKNVVELHGNVNRTRCSNPACQLAAYSDTETHLTEQPLCVLCNSPLRMDIVLFGEGVDSFDIKMKLKQCDLFIAIGTSGMVQPAAGFAEIAKSHGARTILVNLEQHHDDGFLFHETIIARAEQILPTLLDVL